MSTKKEKCCEKCLSTNGWMKGECFNGNCTCHQSESIEWEKDLSFRFDTWLKLYPGTPTIGEIEEWWLESLRISITTAVAKDRELGNPYNSFSTWKEIGKNRGYWDFFKDQVISAREKEIADEVEKIKTYTGGSSVNEKDKRVNKAEVLSILKH